MTSSPDPDVQGVATDVYVFGYPLLLMDITRQLQTNTVEVTDELALPNQFCHHGKLPDPAMKIVVRPNLDTLYSQAWLDLSDEPMVLSVPDMPGRYWLMQILDSWTNTCENPSSTNSGTSETHDYLVTGPGWSGDTHGLTQLPMPTDTAWIIGRIEVHDDADQKNVQELQKSLTLTPLSAWVAGTYTPSPGTYTPSPGTFDPAIDMETAPAEQVTGLGARDFFDRLCALLATNPPSPDDPDAMAEFATIGIVPGGDVDTLGTDDLEAAKSAALARIGGHAGPAPVNGWEFFTSDIGAYGTDYDQRAYIAMTELGANLPADALYPGITVTADAGTAHRAFTLTFPAGQTPPVDAFWSLTAYDADGFLIANDADIYSIGHRTPAPVPDATTGDTVLLIQDQDPGTPLNATNWLPVPADATFALTLRLYAPRPPALDGTWEPPALTPAD
ncbi:DUF1254 domain-containing protein [Streptomyces sp. NPDC046203]|uniref:DUF1254 domain-containing protein n=1 Tax=Streptomyces sp. NPDC046203 TaxID=3154602 RepID=UPI0033C9B6D3